MSKQSRKVEQLKAEVAESDLELPHKTYAADTLEEVAGATNGTPDKLQAITEAVLANTAYMIRRDIYLQSAHKRQIDEITKIVVAKIEAHVKECPGLQGTTAATGFARVAAFMAAIRPALWPSAIFLSVGAMSPYVGPGLLAWIERMAK
jgi:hypothetical protein